MEVEYGKFLESAMVTDNIQARLSLWEEALEDLTGRNDGYLDKVHALRDRHAADLVLLHLGGPVHWLVGDYRIGGVAWTVYDVSGRCTGSVGFFGGPVRLRH